MDIRKLSKELQSVAETELNEVPGRIFTDLNTFKAWLAKTPHIKSRTNDQFLIAFLRGCKWSIERAKEKLDSFYTIRATFPEIFFNRLVTDDLLNFIRLGVFLPLPHTDGPAGPRIIIYRSGYFDPTKVSFTDVIKFATMLQDIMMLEDDNLIVAGSVFVTDLDEATIAHWRHLTPVSIKKFVTAWQEGNPYRIKGVENINTKSFFLSIFVVLKAFLSEKIRSRVNAYEGIEPLFEKIPRNLLPKEYGGEGGTVPEITEYWVEKLQRYREFFEDDINYGADETKRPSEETKSAVALFGTQGSFRNLDMF